MKLILGDCLDEMENIPDGSVDFVCCDLPYGITASSWDKHIDIMKLWKQYNRIINWNGTIALFSCQPFTTKIISSNLKDFRYCWYWLKNQGIELSTYYKNDYRKMYYIDEYDDFYDEYELLSYLNECFVEYLKTL